MVVRTADLLHGAFWYHDGYRDFMEAAGVPLVVLEHAYAENGRHKARICKTVFKQLAGNGAAGARIAWRVVDSALALSGPYDGASDGQESFDKKRAQLKAATLGRADGRTDEPPRQEVEDRKAERKRQEELDAVRDEFLRLSTDDAIPATERGYALEALIGRLCGAHGIEYTPPLRLPGQQIDGAIKFQGRVLVIEARWRKEKADFGDVQKLSGKARARIVGTLGLFLSMEGFSAEGVRLWLESGHQRDCVLLQGSEFVKAVLGFVSWPDALGQMIDQAAIKGQVLVELSV